MISERKEHVPRYRVIAEDLTGKIRSGRYRAGEALPPQRELSASYGVTLMTLRQALRTLSDEGLVVQRPGRGTYVTPPQAAYPLDTLRSLGDDLRRQGRPVHTEVVSAAIRRIPARLVQPMGVPSAEHKVLRLARVRHLAGRPAVHQVSWIPMPYGSAVKDVDFGATPLYAALADAGVAVHRARERIRPGLLSVPVASRLKSAPGGPVFLSERITFDVDDTVVVLDEAVILGELLEIRAERAATDLSLNWSAQLR